MASKICSKCTNEIKVHLANDLRPGNRYTEMYMQIKTVKKRIDTLFNDLRELHLRELID